MDWKVVKLKVLPRGSVIFAPIIMLAREVMAITSKIVQVASAKFIVSTLKAFWGSRKIWNSKVIYL